MTDPRFDQEPEAWMQRANCLGVHPDIMFPDPGDWQGNRDAVAVCGGCVVKGNCRAYAAKHKIRHGVWGGQTADERAGREAKGTGRRRCRSCHATFVATWHTRPPAYCSTDCADEGRRRRRTA